MDAGSIPVLGVEPAPKGRGLKHISGDQLGQKTCVKIRWLSL